VDPRVLACDCRNIKYHELAAIPRKAAQAGSVERVSFDENERILAAIVRGGTTMRLISNMGIVVVVLAAMASSAQASPRQDVAFVANCYRQYLQRDPEPDGLRGWVDQLRGGASRDQVRAGILASDEYYALQGGNDRDFVIGLYRDVLGRDAARSEVDGWVQAIRGHGGDRRDVTYDFVISARDELRRRP
jgi:hypothetical protein